MDSEAHGEHVGCAADDRWTVPADWHLMAERVAKNPDGLELPALLDRIESEMADSAPEVQ